MPGRVAAFDPTLRRALLGTPCTTIASGFVVAGTEAAYAMERSAARRGGLVVTITPQPVPAPGEPPSPSRRRHGAWPHL